MQGRLERCSEELLAARDEGRQFQSTIEEYCGTLEAMRGRLRDMEQGRQRQDEEIIRLLSRQNELMRLVELSTVQMQSMRHRVGDCCCGAFDSTDLGTANAAKDVPR